jgi:chromosomal replication initiation ATPase DnaA
MSIAIVPERTTPANDVNPAAPRGPYARYADLFSRIYAETGSIEIALEVYETQRAREDLLRPKRLDLPERVVELAAAAFGVTPSRLYAADRHSAVVAARRVASWVLRRRHWSKQQIGDYFHQDHSTVITGLRVVANDQQLLLAAHKAAHMLELDEAAAASLSAAVAGA